MTKTLGLFVILLAGLSLISLLEVRNVRRELRETQEQNDLLRSEARLYTEHVRGEIQGLSHRLAALESDAPKMAEQQVQDKPLPTDEPSARVTDSGNTWRAKQAVAEVEERLALNSDQRDQLTKRFQEHFSTSSETLGSAPYQEFRTQALTDVLGPGMAQQFEQLEQAADDREFNERIDRDTIVFSRRLALTESQEKSTREALTQAEQGVSAQRTLMKDKMREAMATHMEGPQAKGKLQAQYDDIQALSDEIKRKRDQLLFSLLENNLSDKQKNELLALQAEKE